MTIKSRRPASPFGETGFNMTAPKHPLKSIFNVSLLIHNLNKEAERRAGLSIVQWSLLKHLLEMPGASALELSDAVGLHPSTLTQTLKRLIRKKWVLVLEDPRDSRKKIICLTRAGKGALDLAEHQMGEIAANIARAEKELYVFEECLSDLRYRGLNGPEDATR
jgi:DNA-binding MarR family transcriptional regulator